MKLLNIACGGRFHSSWVNIDFHKTATDVMAVNILKGLPFSDNSFKVAYSSHFFEHLAQRQIDFVLSEIYRILDRGGVLRIVVPDLENLCREYLDILTKVQSDGSYKEKYDWIVIEFLDQLVRTEAGGNMVKIYNDIENGENKSLRDFILYRVGVDISMEYFHKNSFMNKIGKISISLMKEKLFYFYILAVSKLIPKKIRENIFSKTSIGEKHLWMYDRYSLTSLVEKAGFKDVKIMDYDKSSIHNFNDYLLDINGDGTSDKGISSLYLECRK